MQTTPQRETRKITYTVKHSICTSVKTAFEGDTLATKKEQNATLRGGEPTEWFLTGF